MKNRTSAIIKQIISALTSMAKAKTLAFKSKTRAIKARLVIFSLISNRKFLMTSISHKFQSLTGHDRRHLRRRVKEDNDQENLQATMVYNHKATSCDFHSNPTRTHFIHHEGNDEEEEINEERKVDNYPGLTHSLFESEDIDLKDPRGSVIAMVKNSKEQEGQEFRLEDEIDQVADLFIRRFHHQMWMQKQHSFKKYQERSA